MPSNDFKVEIFDAEVVVRHGKQGHRYRFPILDKATVGLRGVRIDPNGKAKRGAKGYLIEAHKAAQAALKDWQSLPKRWR
jgi:hypothetical protein